MNGIFAFFQWNIHNVLPILLGVVALGIVVFIHELGHFIVAKLRGIRVEVFSIGFPPKIFGFTRGGTEYRLSWIFFGGYVKLAGMEFEEGVDPRKVEGGYFASPVRTRLAVCACGPLMNLLSAFLIYCFLYVAGFPVPANMESTVIGSVVENSPAATAGLRQGDEILEIDGGPVQRWEDVTKAIVYSPGRTVELAARRDGEVIRWEITPERDEKQRLKRIGIFPVGLVSVVVLPDSIAGASGMEQGDFIVAVNGGKIYSWNQLVGLIQGSEGVPVKLGLLRGGEPEEVTVVPRQNEELGYPAIGIKLRMTVPMEELQANGLVVYIRRNPFSWIAANIREMYLTIRGLIVRAVSPRGLAGPIGIIQIMSYSMRAGTRQFLYVMAFISVNLAVLNLLPIPVLDGGHILLALIEGARRRPLSVKAMTVVQNIFLVILLALMAFVFANDIIRNWGGPIRRLFTGPGHATPTPEAGDKP